MKNIFKFIALAAIISLAALSCSNDLEVVGYDFKTYNEQYNPSVNTWTANHTPILSVDASELGYLADTVKPWDPNFLTQELIIEFAANADFLTVSNDKLEAELKKFLTFYSVGANPDGDMTTWAHGYQSVLTEIPFTVAKDGDAIIRYENTIALKLKDNYAETESPRIAYKVDATRYTFNNGQKMDIDGFGGAGEAFYDDVWGNFTIATTGESGKNYVFYGPRRTTFDMNIYSLPMSATFPNATATTATAQTNVVVANASASLIGGTTSNDRTLTNTIFGGLAGNFKVEKNTGTGWSATDIAVTYVSEDSADNGQFRIASFAPEHRTAYRVVYTGDTVFTTAEEYEGGKRRVVITGPLYDADYNKHDTGRVTTGARFYANSALIDQEDLDIQGIEIISKSETNRNYVVDFYVANNYVDPAAPTVFHYFKEMTLSEFRDNFKIIATGAGSGWTSANDLQQSNEWKEIRVNNVQFLKSIYLQEEIATNTGNTYNGYDIIRITFDPNFDFENSQIELYAYTNEKVGLTSKINFGDAYNWEWGNWELTVLP